MLVELDSINTQCNPAVLQQAYSQVLQQNRCPVPFAPIFSFKARLPITPQQGSTVINDSTVMKMYRRVSGILSTRWSPSDHFRQRLSAILSVSAWQYGCTAALFCMYFVICTRTRCSSTIHNPIHAVIPPRFFVFSLCTRSWVGWWGGRAGEIPWHRRSMAQGVAQGRGTRQKSWPVVLRHPARR